MLAKEWDTCTQVCISDDTRVDDGDMMGILRLRRIVLSIV